MQPTQPGPITPNHNPYDFIVAPQKPPKKSLFAGGSLAGKLLLGVGVLAIITVVLVALASLSGGTTSKDDYLKLLQQHAEIIRVAQLGETTAKDTPAQNLAIVTKQTFESQQTVVDNMALAGGLKKINPKEIALGVNAETDTKLTTAGQLNRFDEEFTSILKAELKDYQTTLKKIYDTTKSATDKANLEKIDSYIVTLLNGNPAAQSKTGNTDSTPATN